MVTSYVYVFTGIYIEYSISNITVIANTKLRVGTSTGFALSACTYYGDEPLIARL